MTISPEMFTPYMIIAWIVYGLTALIIFILGIVLFIIKRREIKSHLKSALALGVFIMILHTILLVIAACFSPDLFRTFLNFLFLPISFFTIVVFISVGGFFCKRLKLPGIPDIRRKRISRPKKFYLVILIAILLMFLYSALLFWLTHPSETSFAKEIWKIWTERFGLKAKYGFTTILLLLAAKSISEEVTFRLFIQNMLGYSFKRLRWGYFLTIILTASIWALPHAGVMNPEWVKFAQVFVLGIILGLLMRRQGVASCMIAHMVFNFSYPFLEVFI